MEKRLAILLTIHNREIQTLECLKRVYELILPKDFLFDCYLVDDDSTDNSRILIEENYPKVKIIDGNGDLFWNRGMHLAWKTAISFNNYDFYLWLNNDTFLFDGALFELIECYKESNEDVLVCGATCDLTHSTFTYGGYNLNGQTVIPNSNLQQCEIINGNIVLVSRSICKSIGILDPIFSHAIGDHEYGLRAIKKGFKIYTTRKYIGICEQNESHPKWCYSHISLIERFKSLYSPLANAHPFYFFIYEFRYFGIITAIKHFITIHLRALIPSLWK